MERLQGKACQWRVATYAWTKLYTKFMSWISGVYKFRLCMALTWSMDHIVYVVRVLYYPCLKLPLWSKFILLVGSLPFHDLWQHIQTRSKLPCVLQLQSSPLRLTDAALWKDELDLCNFKINRAHLKFTAYGCKQASKQASKQTYNFAHAQCSPASVGLTQGRPNNFILGDQYAVTPSR